MDKIRVKHTFGPVCDRASKILILGSFPSVKSREGQFYYHHPQNRFWKVISILLNEPLPVSVSAKKELLLKKQVALWDVIDSCDIRGSSDNTIENVEPNAISKILDQAPIQAIFCNGAASYKLYQKYCEPETGRPAVKLPSTSPANAVWTLEKLLCAWKIVIESLDAENLHIES